MEQLVQLVNQELPLVSPECFEFLNGFSNPALGRDRTQDRQGRLLVDCGSFILALRILNGILKILGVLFVRREPDVNLALQ